MKLALFGYGRMGREVEKAGAKKNHTCPIRIDPNASGVTHGSITPEELADADVCVDFSLAAGVLDHIRLACAAGRPIVVGATAWEKDLSRARDIVEASGGALIYAPNFSMGMQTLFRLAGAAAKALGSLPDLDAAVFEAHHRGKADSPSGTALRLGEILLGALKSKDALRLDPPQGAIGKNELHIASLRCGLEPGVHTVTFDLGEETLELTHRSRSRAALAQGAIQAAEWIKDKKGFYTFAQMLFGEE